MQPLPAPPPRKNNSNGARDTSEQPQRPGPTPLNLGVAAATTGEELPKKKRKHRGGKKKRNRRPSFAGPSDISTAGEPMPRIREPAFENVHDESDDGANLRSNSVWKQPSFRLGQQSGRAMSTTSVDSDVLWDHRNHTGPRPRRDSRIGISPAYNSAYNNFGGNSPRRETGLSRKDQSSSSFAIRRRGKTSTQESYVDEDPDLEPQITDDWSPLPGSAVRGVRPHFESGYGNFNGRRESSSSSRRNRNMPTRQTSFPPYRDDDEGGYDVNNPPSVPVSPILSVNFDNHDVMIQDLSISKSPDSFRNRSRDALIDVDGRSKSAVFGEESAKSPKLEPGALPRRRTLASTDVDDVCLPEQSIADDEDIHSRSHEDMNHDERMPHRRRRRYPDLRALNAWAQDERELIAENMQGAKQINEPTLIDGRLRASQKGWHPIEEDQPYRWTYFNEEFESTLHAQTLSELANAEHSFRELFIPEPRILSDSENSSSDESEAGLRPSVVDKTLDSEVRRKLAERMSSTATNLPGVGDSKKSESKAESKEGSTNGSGEATPLPGNGPSELPMPAVPLETNQKLGPRPTWWLDILCPTSAEMRLLSLAFGIHALTAEDIIQQETREKVEMFRNYYFINYRTFEQDPASEDYMEPVNMYICVFPMGVMTFHFSQSPHGANVRRRIRQLKDYMLLTQDWICYALIDDITDVFGPMITQIEAEVDDIDEGILRLFHDTQELKSSSFSINENNEKASIKSSSTGRSVSSPGIDTLRHVGECRKKVMGLSRLLGNKADVIKQFSKRCNEQWEVAPRSEIGLYLGDIQDHIVTMTGNLSHYEALLSRAHSNYLAQVHIRMNERSEKNGDILGKLTVVGTIVLPMNIICGMWGMNVRVPGQDIENLYWFWSITAGLILFAVSCFIWAKKVYGIV